MKTLRSSLCALAAALVLTAVSHATPFDFSYTFGDGTAVTGTLDGTANGNYVDNVSNVSLSFNGNLVTGPVFLAQFDGTDYVSGGVVSFDASLNNFLFINGDFLNGGGFDSFFTLHPDSGTFAALHSDLLALDALDGPGDVHAWSLTTPTPANVPEAGSTLALVAFAALGLLGLRRRLAR